MTAPLQILIAEDNRADAKLEVLALKRAGFNFEHHLVDSEEDYLRHLHEGIDVILSDYEMPQFGALRALELLKERALEIPFIIVSGTIGEDLAVAAIKQGAADYLLKDRLARLGPSIEQAIEKSRLQRERRKAREELRESEARFRQLAENIQEVFWLKDIEKDRLLYVSPAYEVIWGRPSQELHVAPHAWLEPMHPEDRERIAASAAANQLQGNYDEEYRIIRPDGSIRWIRDRAFPVATVPGHVDRIAGIARDITEHKQAEESLRLFRNLVDQSDDAFEVVDPETGRYLDVNDRGCMVCGYTRAEFLSLRVFDLDTAVTEAEWHAMIERIRDSGETLRERRTRRRKDGSIFPIELNIRWVRLDREYLVAVARDVTERERAEARVHEQAAMLNLAHDAIIVRRFHDRHITFWNKGAEHLYGWTSGEAVGRDIGELISIDADHLAAVDESLLQTESWQGERRQISKAGKKLVVTTRATLVRDAQGRPDQVLVINADITEQKSLEARFLRAQRMESIGTLASGLAHDLNNILSPILMSIPLLRRELPPKQRDEVVNTIHMSAGRGADIIKQVLTFGRGLESSRNPLNAGAIIREIAKIVRQTFPRDIEIVTSLDSDLWKIEGDATQLHQVLLNLCVNARDAMPGGGRLFLEARNLDLDESYASMLPGVTVGPNVLIEVRDTGSGIPPEIIDRIFDPFYTTKAVGQGTGLGLSTVLGIVKNHGGHVGVASEAGGGTAFQIHLPALRGEDLSVEGVRLQEGPPLGNGEWILIADDEAAIRRAAQIVLEAHGYRVITASDGAEALAAYAQNSSKIALVLTDLMMPHLDGVGLIQALRKIGPNTPIIVSTGLEKKAHVAQLRSLNIHATLNKPYGADVLLDCIHQALQDSCSIAVPAGHEG